MPVTLTQWDLSFLKGVYASTANAWIRPRSDRKSESPWGAILAPGMPSPTSNPDEFSDLESFYRGERLRDMLAPVEIVVDHRDLAVLRDHVRRALGDPGCSAQATS